MSSSGKATLLLLFAGLSCAGQDFHKLTIEAGAGPTLPIGSAKDRWNTGWNILLGAGYNFTPHIAGLVEFQYDHFSLSNSALQTYNQPDGFIRFWSFSFSPRYDFNPRGKFDVYATGGYGLYGRELAFTDPSQIQQVCDPYYGYCESTRAPVIASFTNYRGGMNLGGGVSYGVGGSGLKFFTDVRYNRFMSHNDNEFITVTLGIKY